MRADKSSNFEQKESVMYKFRTLELATNFYHRAKDTHLPRPLKDQFDRSLLSIVLNLSEGAAKPTAKDKRKFYYIAMGSFRETQTLLRLTNHQSLLTLSDSLGAHLYKLCKNTK